MLSYADGILWLGQFALNANMFEALRHTRGQRSETIPVEVQEEWMGALAKTAEELWYFAHTEITECRTSRPCGNIVVQFSAPVCWDIAGHSRDAAYVGQLVASIQSMLTRDQQFHLARLAKSIATTVPLCRLMELLLRCAGIDTATPTDADIICALCVAVGRYEGHLACAYSPRCNNTAAAIDILSEVCKPSLPRLLGLLSPLLSRPLL
jgi:hypothetical protein